MLVKWFVVCDCNGGALWPSLALAHTGGELKHHLLSERGISVGIFRTHYYASQVLDNGLPIRTGV